MHMIILCQSVYQQEIHYKKMEIAKMKLKIQQRRDYMVGRAFLDMCYGEVFV